MSECGDSPSIHDDSISQEDDVEGQYQYACDPSTNEEGYDWEHINSEESLLGRSDENNDNSFETQSAKAEWTSESPHNSHENKEPNEEDGAQDLKGTCDPSSINHNEEPSATIEDVDPFEDMTTSTKSERPKTAISPIEWDRISEGSENRDELHVDAPGDEFTKEEEARTTLLNHGVQPKERTRPVQKPLPDLRHLFKSTKYFMIKSNNFENVEIAKTRNVWATTKGNETRLNKAFFDYSNVLLIFSVRESGRFQGFARIIASSDPRIRVDWVLPSRMNTGLLSNPFRIKWICKSELPFTKTGHLTNPWNENKPVKIGRDGQEIEPTCGESLCRLFFEDEHNEEIKPPYNSQGVSERNRRNAFERLGKAVGRVGQSNLNGSRPPNSGLHTNIGLLGDAAGTSQRYTNLSERRGLMNYPSVAPLLGVDGSRLVKSGTTPLMQVNAAAAAMAAAAAAMAAIKSNNPSITALARSATSGLNNTLNNPRLPIQTTIPNMLSTLTNSSNSLSRLTSSGSGSALLPLIQQQQLQLAGSAANAAAGAVLSQALQARGLSANSSANPHCSVSTNPLLTSRPVSSKVKRSSSRSTSGSTSYSYARERNPRHGRIGGDYMDNEFLQYDSVRRQSHSPRRRDVGSRRINYQGSRGHRSRSRSGSLPIDRNLLMSWNYDDYVQQVSRGFRPNVCSNAGVISGGSNNLNSSIPIRDTDLRYEEKVDAFLRGIGSRGMAGGERSFSHSPSRSCSYSPNPGHSYGHRGYRGSSSYSGSRSPSGSVRPHRTRRNEVSADHYYHRMSAHASPRHRGCSRSRSRSPRSIDRDVSAQWRRQAHNSSQSTNIGRRRPLIESRAPVRQGRSPRPISSGSSRPFVTTSRRHR